MAGVNNNHRQSTSGTTSQAGGATTWAPPLNSTLAKDKAKVTTDQFLVQTAVQAHSVSTGGLSTPQAQYNHDQAYYKNDLASDLASVNGTSNGSSHDNLT